MPGGDNIGSRKLDMHFRGLQEMGAELEVVHGFIEARCTRLRGARIVLDFPSVGATENLLTAAVLAKGEHGDRERGARAGDQPTSPSFLNRMGAHIFGAGHDDHRDRGRRRASCRRGRGHGRPHRGGHAS